jgi:septal ring factor EnvC (AmiA/AmiB activator)
MTTALLRIAVLAALVLPGPAMAQSGVDGRLNELQRALSSLSAQLEQLKAQNQQLQHRLETMQTSIGQRLEHLEKTPAKPAPRPAPAKR